MHDSHCTALMRALHARRQALTLAELRAAFVSAPTVRALVQGAQRECAALAPRALVAERLALRVARELTGAARDTPWRPWLTARALHAAETLTTEDPRTWRHELTLPTPFEQSLAAALGIEDAVACTFLRHFHAVPRAERAPLHRMLDAALVREPEPRPARSARAEAEAEAALRLLRRLLAGLRLGAG